MSFWSRLFGPDHKPRMGGLEIFKYIGPGLLVTVGFIDPATGLQTWPQAHNTDTRCYGW